jgi:subtilisin family serine protease
MRGLLKLMAAAFTAVLLTSAPIDSYALMGPDDFDFPEPPEIDPGDIEAPDIEIPDIEIPEIETPEVEVEAPEPDEPAEVEASDDANALDDHGGHSGRDADDNPSTSNDDVVQSHIHEPMEVERNHLGEEYVAREVLVAATRSDIGQTQSRGFTIISAIDLGAGERQVARLLTPSDLTVEQSIRYLRDRMPGGIVTINNAYRSSQVRARRVSQQAPRARAIRSDALVGVIDTGASVDGSSTILSQSRGFGSAGYAPREHGSAVVSIITRFGAHAQVADVFGPSRSGQPYASASAIIAAMRWMVESGVPVINISIEGPRNPILEAIVLEAARDGHVIVAAAGNGGPLARPAYPGAYEGVVAVTAVDASGRAYLRANRGDYIYFSALGVDVPVDADGDSINVTGTSFAAPIVAAQIARSLREPSPAGAQSALATLRRTAIDRGAPGRDPVYGWGEIRDD